MINNEYVSLRVLSGALGLSADYLRGLSDKGLIPYLQVRSQRRFNIAQVNEVLLKLSEQKIRGKQ